MANRIWSTRRQVLGNAIPLFAGAATFVALTPLPILGRLVAALAMTYLGVNQWGFFENRKIEAELRCLTESKGELIGFVHRKAPTVFDAHAEIGMLTMHEDRLDIVTEDGGLILNRTDIVHLSRQRNIHTIIGLGGWIALELRSGTTFRFESRKYHTMLGSKVRTASLFRELERWHKLKSPA